MKMRIQDIEAHEVYINTDHLVRVSMMPETGVGGQGNQGPVMVPAHGVLVMLKGDDIKVDCGTANMIGQILALKVTEQFVIDEKNKTARRRNGTS